MNKSCQGWQGAGAFPLTWSKLESPEITICANSPYPTWQLEGLAQIVEPATYSLRQVAWKRDKHTLLRCVW